MQKFNLTFLKKILLFALSIIIVLLSIIFSSKLAFQKTSIQNQIISYKTLLLESQIYRKEFEITKDTNKVNKILENLKYIRLNNNNILDSNFLIHLQHYEKLIYLLRINYSYKGLDENTGLEGQFRKSIHDLENNLFHKKDKNLLILVLQIRRSEKDYINRKNPKYILQVNNLVSQIETIMNSKNKENLSVDSNSIILNNYIRDFKLLTEIIKEIDFLENKIKTLENQINVKIQNKVIEKNNEANLFLKVQDYIFLISILFIAVISYILARSISKPLNALKIATHKISHGDYSYRAEIITNDEIGNFTALFNTMVSKLQVAHKKIESDKQELENIVKERTNYLINTIEELKVITNELESTKLELLNKNFEIVDNLEKEQDLNELKTKFVQTVSHEYRTPLTIILNSTYLIEQYSKVGNTEQLNIHNNRIKEAVSTMKLFLEDLFTIEKLDYGKIDIKFTEFNLISFIKSFIVELNLDNNLKVELIDTTKSNQIVSDIAILTQIFNNIISNCNKYKTNRNNTQIPKISISVSDEVDIFKVEIEDNGIGIVESEIKLIFEAFFRGSNISNIQGMGIGLTMTKKYLELLNSKIFVESEVNIGTKVILELPKEQN